MCSKPQQATNSNIFLSAYFSLITINYRFNQHNLLVFVSYIAGCILIHYYVVTT